MKSIIVGAGPVGTYLAAQLAQKEDVTLVEEHAHIGAPVQCTGILTNDILKFMTKKELRNITKAVVTQTTIFSPNKKVTLDISPNYVIDNIAHSQHYANIASDKGAQVLTKTRYVSNNNTVTLKNLRTQKTSTHSANTLIGADGPTSSVAKNNSMYGKREFLTGVQAVVKVKDYDEKIHFHPHIGEYSWYCPQGEGRARIGVAARHGAKKIFDDFIKKYPGKIENMQGGPIPLYAQNAVVRTQHKQNEADRTQHKQNAVVRTQRKTWNGVQRSGLRVDLIGDSVPLIKNTTGGGIIPGTHAAHIYAQNPEKYPHNITGLKRELYAHYLINKAMNKFNEKDWDKLIEQVSDEKIKSILKKTNRDNALGMMSQLILAKPQLLLWGRKIL